MWYNFICNSYVCFFFFLSLSLSLFSTLCIIGHCSCYAFWEVRRETFQVFKESSVVRSQHYTSSSSLLVFFFFFSSSSPSSSSSFFFSSSFSSSLLLLFFFSFFFFSSSSSSSSCLLLRCVYFLRFLKVIFLLSPFENFIIPYSICQFYIYF